MAEILEWMKRSRCRDLDAETFFVDAVQQHARKRICIECPVRFNCLGYALDENFKYGVWGGLTERERRSILKRNSRVKNWTKLFRETGKIQK